MQARLFAALRLLALTGIVLLSGASHVAHAADDFLEPDKAFRFSARAVDPRTVEVSFDIAPGYYLYREQFRFVAEGATLGAAVIPPGHTKFDETFQKNVETYRDNVRIAVPVQAAGGDFKLVTTSQGCADAGLCYPPMQSGARVSLTGFGGQGTVTPLKVADGGPGSLRSGGSVTGGGAAAAGIAAGAEPRDPGGPGRGGGTGTGGGSSVTAGIAATSAAGESAQIDSVLHGGAFWPVIGAFFVAGLLLSLTPCVLPMLPIISSIIVGDGGPALAGGRVTSGPSRSRGLMLAASYSLGMALVYTAFGVAAGLAGTGLAAALQNGWVLGAFALGLVGLSLSMFGFYELQLPHAITGRCTEAAKKMPAGKVAGVCAMGGVSALIVSPCVAAPLAGALLYLSQTRDVVLGGTALFSLAAGMSVPLLLVGASAGALLPRSGAWMAEVKSAFGVVLLGVALWTVQPVLPQPLALALWGVLALGAAAWVYRRGFLASTGGATRAAPAWRLTVAGVLGVAGLLQLVGAAAGGTDPLQPLAPFMARGASPASTSLRFTVVRSTRELDEALRTAGRPVMLDFYADWCVSCKEMERYTFTDAAVQKKLAGAMLLKADVTANNADDRELLKRFSLFGPPGTIFFDAAGNEQAGTRLIGFQSSDRFLQTLQAAGL